MSLEGQTTKTFADIFAERNIHLASLPTPEFTEEAGFSFLTSVYRNTDPDFFDLTAKSVLDQSYKNFEWIVLRHGPIPERLAARLDELEKDGRITLYSLEENLGIIRGVRFCLEKAAKQYVISMDSDDLIVPEALAVLTRTMMENDFPDLCHSNEVFLMANGEMYPWFRGEFDPLTNFSSSYIAHLVAMKRAVALELGVYTNRKAEYCHDWDTITRFYLNGRRIKHVNEVLYLWRQHARSTSNNGQEYTLADESQRETLKFALAAKGQSENFAVEEFPIFRGAREFRCRWTKAWPNRMFLLITGGRTNPAAREAFDAFLARSRIFPEDVRFVAETGGRDDVRQLRAAIGRLPDEAWCCVLDHRLEPHGRWLLEETAGWFSLMPELDFLCGNIVDGQGLIVDGGNMFSFDGLLGSPEAGGWVGEPGPFAWRLKPRLVDAPNSRFFCAKVPALRRLLDDLPGDTPLSVLGIHIGIHCRLNQRAVGWSPLMLADMKIPFSASMTENFDPDLLPPGQREILSVSRHYPEQLSRTAGSGWFTIYGQAEPSHAKEPGDPGKLKPLKRVSRLCGAFIKRKAPSLCQARKILSTSFREARRTLCASVVKEEQTPSFSKAPVINIDVKEILTPASRPDLLVLLPRLNPGPAPDKYEAVFFLAAAGEDLGRVHVLSVYPPACSGEMFRRYLAEDLGLPEETAARFTVSPFMEAVIHRNDKIMATDFGTALAAQTLIEKLGQKNFIYVPQNFDPLSGAEAMVLADAACETDFLPFIWDPT
ncbi:MAG: glycosyltransferase, partial [Clostridium sp.]|nr:glycosyltransferase [Clostridium sp.]